MAVIDVEEVDLEPRGGRHSLVIVRSPSAHADNCLLREGRGDTPRLPPEKDVRQRRDHVARLQRLLIVRDYQNNDRDQEDAHLKNDPIAWEMLLALPPLRDEPDRDTDKRAVERDDGEYEAEQEGGIPTLRQVLQKQTDHLQIERTTRCFVKFPFEATKTLNRTPCQKKRHAPHADTEERQPASDAGRIRWSDFKLSRLLHRCSSLLPAVM